MAVLAAANELHVVKNALSAIPEVEKVFAASQKSSLAVMVVLPEKDMAAVEKIVSIEGDVIDAFPWLDIDFDVVFRCGRSLNEVVAPKGTLLFSR